MGAYEQQREKILYINKGLLAYRTSAGEIDTMKAWEGHLVNIETKMITPGENAADKTPYEALNIYLFDGRETVIVACKLNSGYGKAFAKIIGNADLQKPIAIVPTYDDSDGTKKSGMFIEQDRKALKWYFTKDDPKGMPQPKEFVVNGKTVWDFTDQINFLRNHLLNEIKPNLPHAATVDMPPYGVPDHRKPAYTPPPPSTGSSKSDIQQEEDDLPF